MSHDGPTLKAMQETTSDIIYTYMKEWFTFRQEDGTETMLHVDSNAGKKAISDIRLYDGFDADWHPITLDPMVALRKLLTASRAHVVRQHGGMEKGVTRDRDFVVNAELGLRSNPPQDTTGDAAQPPATPVRQKFFTPDHEGIEYPSEVGYSMPS
jgi:hypothetical protein